MKPAIGFCSVPHKSRSPSVEAEIRSAIRGLLASYYPEGLVVERRHERRFPYPHLVYLTPVAADGETPQGEPLVVVGKHLSEGGLGFFHQHPLACRQALVSMELADGQWYGLAIELTWCRFTRQGWYESGGRFLRTVTDATPLNRSRQPAANPD